MLESITSRFFNKRFSKNIAKNRLQMVLVQDRSGLTAEQMESFRKDLLEVIARYFLMENRGVEIEWQRARSCTTLVINTPVIGRHKLALVKEAAVQPA